MELRCDPKPTLIVGDEKGNITIWNLTNLFEKFGIKPVDSMQVKRAKSSSLVASTKTAVSVHTTAPLTDDMRPELLSSWKAHTELISW